MILFYFHGSVKHFNIVNACSVVDLVILKAEPVLKQSYKLCDDMVNNIFQSSRFYQRKQKSARKLPGYFDVCYLSWKSSSLLCGLDSVQIRLSSKYGCTCALRLFVPIGFFQLLLEHILFPTDNCLVKRKKVKKVMKLLPQYYFKHLMSIQFK